MLNRVLSYLLFAFFGFSYIMMLGVAVLLIAQTGSFTFIFIGAMGLFIWLGIACLFWFLFFKYYEKTLFEFVEA